MTEKETKQKVNAAPKGGPGSIGAPVEKPKHFWKSFGELFRYMGKYRILVCVVVVFAAGSTVFQVIGPKTMGHATTELAEGLMRKIGGTGGIDFDQILKILLMTLSLYLISALLSFLQGWIMTSVTQNVCYKMRKEISQKINRMPMQYFERRTVGEVLSRITNDVDTLGMGLQQSISMVITSVATIVGVIVMMLTISPLMTIIALVILPLSAALMALVVRFSQRHFNTQQKFLGHINGQVEETFAGQMVIKAFCREEKATEKFDQTNEVLYESAWKSQFLSGIMMPIMMFVGNLGYAGVAIAGGFLAIRGTIGIGDIQAFIQYVKNFTQPLQQIAQVMNQMQSMTAAAERIFEFLDEEEEQETGNRTFGSEPVKGKVQFQHVRFGYDPDQVIIHDFTAVAKPGQKIAIVGPTGAGKTTIVKLLMRFYDVNDGAIDLDGQDIRNYRRQDLRSQFGMVLQDTWLFSGTIRENIRFGRLDATNEEVEAAARASHADHFIQTLPDGYDMVLNEDASNISQGQKQLLTIARAILADSPVMILDEATSSVDTRTEELIQDAMDRLMEGRTSFVIAHRLSTIRNADLILVMQHGDIIEQGTHETLLKQNGAYAELYRSQFEAAV